MVIPLSHTNQNRSPVSHTTLVIHIYVYTERFLNVELLDVDLVLTKYNYSDRTYSLNICLANSARAQVGILVSYFFI